jgi:hypothetical protein
MHYFLLLCTFLHSLQCSTTPGWLDALLVCGQTLEAVQKGLEDYLETKRVAFPRYTLWQWTGLVFLELSCVLLCPLDVYSSCPQVAALDRLM